ncbi:related to D-lactate dehydrogenase [cytochrome], mitochondrial [Saccharomycodes ludwigii]|uniref:D-lactate dehydrogenase (cytochrome) n=1 Tax=Saccharomycodes ludwigii TaxID=36035 RepID=A0A376B369_9ASCO|nr:related to D-lactate dehydrogenase [cytochrome], mitochondrial [Saccharomycodes ludwigii]
MIIKPYTGLIPRLALKLQRLKSLDNNNIVNKTCFIRFVTNSSKFQNLKTQQPPSPVTNSKTKKKTYFVPVSIGILIGIALSIGIFKNETSNVSLHQIFPSDSTTPLASLQPPKYGSDDDLEKCILELGKILTRDQITNSIPQIISHSDNGYCPTKPLPSQKPRYIVYPTSTEEVSKIMKIVHKYSIPVVPYGGGTSLEGHIFSTRSGIVLDISRMNKILEVYPEDLDATVQAGVGWQQLNEYLAKQGLESLKLGCDCGPGANICGMIATNASGIGAVKGGSMVRNVISITAVLADGTIIKTKNRPRKTSAGYNLNGLLVGSEGTLAIVTECTVKLQVVAPVETVAVAQFPSVVDCTKCVSELFRKGIVLDAVELLDDNMMRIINESGLVTRKWGQFPTLFFKIGGLNKTVLNEVVKEVTAVSKKNNCKNFDFAKNEDEQKELFDARKNALYIMLAYAQTNIHEDAKMWITDVAVPLSKLASVVKELQDIIKESPFEGMVLGHVGDGNLHANLFYTPDQVDKCRDIAHEMTKVGIANEGTCTGEHGIGNGKRDLLELEVGPDTISTMRKIKLALDSRRILNPDKVFKIDPLDENP